MILDGHIHLYSGRKDVAAFVDRLGEAGVDGGVVLSVAPAAFGAFAEPTPASERLDEVMSAAQAAPRLFPFFWLDPMEPDASQQIERAVRAGVAGFKIISHSYEPGARRAMELYRQIAAHNKPILFHSGILWDAAPSSRFCRPVEFEPLLEVQGLRFALAHVGWPWCDELIAVFGKFWSARRVPSKKTSDMFVDLTPGTPAVYRRDALTKLFGVEYDAETRAMFGSDASVNNYDVALVREYIDRDNAIYDEIGVDAATRRAVSAENLLRFVGEHTEE